MPSSTPATAVCRYVGSSRCFSVGLWFLALNGSAAMAVDDAYLDLLNEEATKVEPEATDTKKDDVSGVPAVAPARAGNLASREAFEASLRKENVGTYSLYRRLPERSREEVFLDYRRGASMEALREKVVNRYTRP